jgi:hypothetical protein
VLLHHTDPTGVDPDRLDLARDYLRRIGARYPLVTVPGTDSAQLVAQGSGVPRLLGTVLADATELAQTDDWTRLKACASTPCQPAFIDRTRNHSARYCTAGCASRATRARPASAGRTPPRRDTVGTAVLGGHHRTTQSANRSVDRATCSDSRTGDGRILNTSPRGPVRPASTPRARGTGGH